MKTNNYWILLPVIVISVLHACSGQNGRDTHEPAIPGNSAPGGEGQPEIAFQKLTHDFGTIIEGEQVVCYFDYRNSGSSELVINSVEATCGCTTPDWSREPLSPGEGASLTIIFDASGRSGAQRKVITVDSNALNSPVRLTVKANVKV